MKRADVFPSQYLAVANIEGREVRVVIEHIAIESVGLDDEQRNKPVLYFKNGTKGLVCNTTNWESLEAAYGEESDNWIGKTAILYVDPRVKYKGKVTKGIRIKTDQPAPAVSRPGGGTPIQQHNEFDPTDPSDDIPF